MGTGEKKLGYCQQVRNGKCILGQSTSTDGHIKGVQPDTGIFMCLGNARDQKTRTSRQLRVKEGSFHVEHKVSPWFSPVSA